MQQEGGAAGAAGLLAGGKGRPAGEATVFIRGGGLLRALRVERSSRMGGGDVEATQSIANPAGTEQRDSNDTLQRVDDLDNREGEASDEERHDQDGLQSGFMSPQVQRRAGNCRAKRQPAPRCAVTPRAPDRRC